MQQYQPLPFVLTKGNHDVLPDAAYDLPQLEVIPEQWHIDPFLLSHKPIIEPKNQRGGWTFPSALTEITNFYNLAGHIHPGATVRL